MQFGPPEPLSSRHKVDDFRCGQRDLDRWLKRHALGNEGHRSRTFVIRESTSNDVAGFYCLSATLVDYAAAIEAARVGMPAEEAIPALLLGRLAVDERYQCLGVGASLLQDAEARASAIAQSAGVRVLLAHAKDAAARDFYVKHGFAPSPLDDLQVMLVL